MGWNINILHIGAPGQAPDGLLRLSDERRLDPIGEHDERAWAHVSDAGITILSRSYFDYDVIERFAASGTAVTHLVIGSTGGAYALEAYRDGSRVRRLIEIDTGEGNEDVGEPLPGEDSVDETYGEDKFFALFKTVTGVENLDFLGYVELTLVASPELLERF